MAYALTTDLELYGVQAAWLADVSTPKKQAAIDHASAYVDSFLAKQYAVPLVAYGDDIKGCTCKIAVWYLLVNKGFNPASFPDKSILLAYEQMIEWLKMLASGELVLSGITESASGASSPIKGLVVSEEPRGF